MAAANKGHLDVVRALVQHNAPLDVKDNDGDTALTFAVIGWDTLINILLIMYWTYFTHSSKVFFTTRNHDRDVLTKYPLIKQIKKIIYW